MASSFDQRAQLAPKELAGKVALITGASRGIGAQIAEELAKRGADLFLTWTPSERSRTSAAEVISRITTLKNNITIKGMPIDLTNPAAPAQVIQECLTNFPHIDILVNNAGQPSHSTVADVSPEHYAQIMDLNLRAPFFLCQAAQPYLRAPARIINISSVAARVGGPNTIVYAMSKAGLEAMTRGMAKAFGKDGTTVNAVAPGVVESELLIKAGQDFINEKAALTPVQQRVGKPDDVAQVVAWLASESSRWISGQMISASGGFLMV